MLKYCLALAWLSLATQGNVQMSDTSCGLLSSARADQVNKRTSRSAARDKLRSLMFALSPHVQGSRSILRPISSLSMHSNQFRQVFSSPAAERALEVVLNEKADGGALAGPFWDAFVEEARAEASALGLSIKSIGFANGRLSILASGAGIDELQQLNNHLSSFIDNSADDIIEALPPFMLEVSSPGIGSVLESDQDFSAFKGFPVIATMSEPFKAKTRWEGTLVGRDDEYISINLKGRVQKLPRAFVAEVALPKAKTERGDMLAT